MNVNEVVPVQGYGVMIEGVAPLLRLDNPLGKPVWYEYTDDGWNLSSEDDAYRFEGLFQDFPGNKELQ